jgi:hypothetical protein
MFAHVKIKNLNHDLNIIAKTSVSSTMEMEIENILSYAISVYAHFIF